MGYRFGDGGWQFEFVHIYKHLLYTKKKKNKSKIPNWIEDRYFKCMTTFGNAFENMNKYKLLSNRFVCVRVKNVIFLCIYFYVYILSFNTPDHRLLIKSNSFFLISISKTLNYSITVACVIYHGLPFIFK